MIKQKIFGSLRFGWAAAIVFVFGLSACQTTGNVPAGLGVSSSAYDGKWAGRINLLAGRYCGDYIKTAGEIRFNVANSLLKTHHSEIIESRLNVGYITKDGTFYGNLQSAQAGRIATTIYKGAASKGVLTGKWFMPGNGCHGEFNLTKVGATPINTANSDNGPSELIEMRLKKLKSLIDKGLITEQDAAQKRQEILEGL